MNNNQNPYQENLENVLEKYGRDITAGVRDGKQERPERSVLRIRSHSS